MFSLTSILAVALVVVLGFVIGKWLFQKDTECEERRRHAGQLAATLKAYGLIKLPDFLISYSVGDYSGMANDIKEVAKLLNGSPEAVIKEFDGVFGRVLVDKLATEGGRTLLAAKLADAVKAGDTSTVTGAPAAKIG
jgi:hypothetical protein